MAASGEGGGVAILAHESIEAVLLNEDPDEEILSVQTKINDLTVNLVTAYAPQETKSLEIREGFFAKLEEECKRAEISNAGLILELDANAKLGFGFSQAIAS